MLSKAQLTAAEKSSLFRDVDPQRILSFLRDSAAVRRSMKTGETVISQGERQTDICLLLSGTARGEKMTADGRNMIINEFIAGHVFGDMLSGAHEESPVTVSMTAAGDVISIPFSGLLASNTDGEVREQIVRNLIGEIAHKYLALLRRLDIMLAPTLRGSVAGGYARWSCSGFPVGFVSLIDHLPHNKNRHDRHAGETIRHKSITGFCHPARKRQHHYSASGKTDSVRARFSTLCCAPIKASRTSPMGPFLCFATLISISPGRSSFR